MLARRRPTICSTSLPRSSATCWTVRSCWSAASVARTVLIGLLVPCDLVRMSLIPAVSMTARMAPPEITPVPGAAGLSMILADPNLSRTSCGMVWPTIGTVIMLRLATSMPLRMASVTSRALPIPDPTRPFMSPTTISALNENLRPPLTTFATRLTRTTRSASSDRSPLECGYLDPMLLKLQSGFAGCVRQSLDSAVIEKAAPVKHDRADPGGLGLRGDRFADLRGFGHAVAIGLELHGGSGSERVAACVVDELGVNMVEAAVDREPRALFGSAHVHTHALMALEPVHLTVCSLDHPAALAPLPALPALRRIFSPRYMTPLPL